MARRKQSKKSLSASQIAFYVLSIIIVLSMVAGLIASLLRPAS